MAQRYGKAGRGARQLAEKRALIRACIGIVALASFWLFLQVLPATNTLGIGALVALAILYKLVMSVLSKKVETKIKEERRAIRGAAAEETISSLLAGLSDDHVVWEDVKCKYGNVDHIVLSRTKGLFLIETKAHGGHVTAPEGRLLLNQHDFEKDLINQTLTNAAWLKDEVVSTTGIDAWINCVIVFTNAFVHRFPPIHGVAVTNKKYLLRTIAQTKANPKRDEALWKVRERLKFAST